MPPYLPLLLPFKLMAQAGGAGAVYLYVCPSSTSLCRLQMPRPLTQGITGPDGKEATVLPGTVLETRVS